MTVHFPSFFFFKFTFIKLMCHLFFVTFQNFYSEDLQRTWMDMPHSFETTFDSIFILFLLINVYCELCSTAVF